MKNEETKGVVLTHYILQGIVAITILCTMGFSYHLSHTMINEYHPHVDAAYEIKYQTTTAHLWFEGKVGGDTFESFEDIIGHIEKAQWYATAMLEGGRTPEGQYLYLKNPLLRKEVEQALEKLNEFAQVTHERYEALEESGIGSDIDQHYDKLFNQLILSLDHVISILHQKINEDFSQYKFVQIFLICVIVILSILSFFIQFRHDKAQRNSIAELKKAKLRTEKSENWLKTTMNSMGDGVIITDHNGLVIYLNPVASSLTGWLLNDAKGKKMTEVFHIVNEETKEVVDDPVNIVIRKNVVIGLANHTELIAKDGTVWPISDSAAPIFDSDNNLQGVVVVFHDVKAQKKVEAEKSRLEAQLRHSFRMEAIGTMAGGIAHDFNNVLAIIIGNADMAIDNLAKKDPARHNVNEIFKASNRAKELVKQILSFNRQDNPKKESYHLCLLVKESLKALKPTIPASVLVKVNMAADCNVTNENCPLILADATQIHRVILNLIVNAVQAMEEQGVLEIGIEPSFFEEQYVTERVTLPAGQYAHLFVTDNGPGIGPDIVEKIYDPFFTTKDVGLGTGMGLSVVHGIMEEHGGNIFVETEPGRGTTFHLYFPVTENKPLPVQSTSDTLTAGNERILLVDDEHMLLELESAILERQGYKVTFQTDSIAALALVKENPSAFDLVITDQTMPNMTGVELTQQILDINPDLPIILCTGYSSKVDKEKSQLLGVREFVTKPIQRKEFLDLVRRILDEK